MDDEFEVCGPTPMPSRRFRWIDLVITTLDSLSGFVDDVVALLCQHANWKNDRVLFAERARADIEAIVSGE